MRYAIGLCVLLSLVSPVGAATLFTEDFEVTLGNIDCVTSAGPCTQSHDDLFAKGWAHWDANSSAVSPSRFDIVSITGHTGASTKVLRMTYNGVESSSDPATGRTTWTCDGCYEGTLQRFFTSTSDYYERYWARYDKIDTGQYGGPVPNAGFTNGGGKHHYIFSNNGNNPLYSYFTDWGQLGHFDFSGQAVNSAGVNFTCPASPNGDGGSGPACNIYPNPRNDGVTMGVWHCIETRISSNLIEAWVDGVKTTNATLTNFVPPGGFNLVKIYRQHGENYYRYEDDFAVGTTRFNDCGGDTTPPAAPTGVIVSMLALTMILGGLYGSLTANRLSTDRLMLGDHSADSATLRTVAVHGGENGSEAVYMVALADRTRTVAAPLLVSSESVSTTNAETKDAG